MMFVSSHAIFSPSVPSLQLMVSQAPNFHTSPQTSSRQSTGQHELVRGAREYGSASQGGGKAQQPGEMHSLAGSSPMLERWQRETAKEGPFNDIDAVVVKRPSTKQA